MPAHVEAPRYSGYLAPLHSAAPVVKTLFLVRHGEAVHNIEEQKAKRLAAAEAEAQGHAEGGEAHKAMVEAARKAVLRNEQLRDASLSTTGHGQTLAAKDELRALTGSGIGLPEPAVVLVSPLQRTLETAAMLFPDHPRVHVCEDLRERRTGLPCDERKMASHLARQPGFSNMDFSGLLSVDGEPAAAAAQASVEDVVRLRRRTAQLVKALRTVEDETICLVTHKGFLRELERGPLGQTESKEFSNCEVRAYDVVLFPDGSVAADLLHSSEAPWSPSRGLFPRYASEESVDGACDELVASLGPHFEEAYPVC